MPCLFWLLVASACLGLRLHHGSLQYKHPSISKSLSILSSHCCLLLLFFLFVFLLLFLPLSPLTLSFVSVLKILVIAFRAHLENPQSLSHNPYINHIFKDPFANSHIPRHQRSGPNTFRNHLFWPQPCVLPPLLICPSVHSSLPEPQ